MTLPSQAIEQLESILFSDDLNEEALDYFGIHGLICASIVGPVPLKIERLIEIIFGHEIPKLASDDLEIIKTAINDVSVDLKQALLAEAELHLPYMDEVDSELADHYDACLESWSCGFMEGFFANEKAWFTKGEDVAAELLLPIMALSGLFDSDEFIEIRKNIKLMGQFEEVLPEQLVDIFLFYHSE